MHHLKATHLLVFCLLATYSFGQGQGNQWYFGDRAGITFDQGEPVSVLDGLVSYNSYTHSEGSSSISDNNGQLLFYTNGEKIWNKYHEVMVNGEGLLGSWSSTQSSLIVPEPNSHTKYYVFTTDGFVVTDLENGFRYSVVDMCLAQDSGAVITDRKNILLLDTVSEKLSAVKHGNGTDYWIVVHKYWSDAFHAFLLTEDGITDEVISNVGYIHQDNSPNGMAAAIGQMKISPDGSRLALCVSNRSPSLFEVFDFDVYTGVVSNSIQFPTTGLSFMYGIEFSPDNSKLFLGAGEFGIYQVDLAAGNSSAVINSIQEVSNPPDVYPFGLQLGPNGKIYVANNAHQALGTINNPNELGSNCNYVPSQLSLNGRECSYALPSFIAGFNYHNNEVDCTTGINESITQTNFKIYPNPINQIGTIEFSVRLNQTAVLQLFDSFGRLVLTSNSTNSDKLVFDTSDLQYGIYFYQVKSETETLARGKFLKENTGHNNR